MLCGLDCGGQRSRRGVVEGQQVAQLRADGVTYGYDHLQRPQRVATQGEKIILDSDWLDPEQPFPDIDDRRFQL